MMDRYIYQGMAPGLLGHTALGRNVDGEFRVQLDDTKHPWAFGWHRAVRDNWVILPPSNCLERLPWLNASLQDPKA
jgi:hypothetical protein